MSRKSPKSNALAAGLIKTWLKTGDFSLTEVSLERNEVNEWVRILRDPNRFQPSLFSGEWAVRNSHPTVGEIRILRVMTGTDAVTRAIARQGKYLYAYPWLEAI